MSNDDNTLVFEGGDDALRDPRLQRALEHAPDRDALPDPRTRDAIHKIARNMATAPAAATPTVLPWWQRLFGSGGKPRARMPWNTAFATLLIVGFVTVLWRQEPVPDARLDGESRVAATAPPPAPPAGAVSPDSLKKDKLASAPAAPDAAAAAPSARADSTRQDNAAAGSQAAKTAPPANLDQARPRAEATTRRPAAAPEAAVREKKAPEPFPQSPIWPSPAPAPSIAPPAAAVPPPVAAPTQPDVITESAQGPAQDNAEAKSFERRARVTEGVGSAPAAPPAATAAPVTPAEQSERRYETPSAPGQSPAPAVAAAPRSAVPAGKLSASSSPSFSALDRWTQFRVSGGDRNAPRARTDVEGLPALLGAVARSAIEVDAPLSAPIEARVELYRGRALLAVLEIAGPQVRWTSGGTAVGTPPPAALDALRDLLARLPAEPPR